MSRAPRFTDASRYARPYVRAEASRKPGYLSAKFKRIRAEQEANAKEAQAVVRPLKRGAAR